MTNMPDPHPSDTPDNPYLWDRNGDPDPATRQLEDALRPLRFQPAALSDIPVAPTPRRLPLRTFAIAAALLLAGIAVYLALTSFRPAPGPLKANPTWQIASKGTIHLTDPIPLKSTLARRTLTTDANSGAVLTAGLGTSVAIEPGARVDIMDGDPQWPWLTVHHGTVFAQSPPQDRPVTLTVFEQPLTLQPASAASLKVDDEFDTCEVACKSGELHITWLEQPTRVAAPAYCSISADQGPSLPTPATMAPNACDSLNHLGAMLQFSVKDPKAANDLLDSFLNNATPKDAPLLWNILWRVQPDQRPKVRDRLAHLIKAPKVNPDAILKLDRAAMDAWWKAAVEAASAN